MLPIRLDKMFTLRIRNRDGETVFESNYISVVRMFTDLAIAVPTLADDLDQDRIVFCLLGQLEIYHDDYICELTTEEDQWAQA